MGRKLGFLLLLLLFGATVETAWSVKHHANWDIGAEGCRVIGGKFYGPSFDFDDETTEALASSGPVAVENAFGSVTVGAGAPGKVRGQVKKRVFRATREQAEEFGRKIKVVVEQKDSGLRVTTNREEVTRENPDVGFETELSLELPPGTRLTLKNEHGRVEVRDVAEATIDNGFDSLKVERVAGAADLKQRHGDLEVSEVGGRLSVVSRHGDVTVRGIAGEGDLDVEHGNVTVEGSAGLGVKMAHGTLEVKTVGGDLKVEAEHSEVTARNVTGSARIATSFDGLTVEGIGGDAILHGEHGRVTARDVKGAVTVDASFDGVTLETIGGPVEVKVAHGGLEADGLASGLKVVSEGDEVKLRRVRGPVEVRTQRGEVSLVPEGPLTESVSIETTHGAVRLEVPAG
ncbi:MAG TPA: DUF4097 family beta strand repeat-containing protein, partial [Vicinamibacteria bacterium]|nr:DUF4097 family beta strand repeat-containing protein [Vicinamibacteria bacterium]